MKFLKGLFQDCEPIDQPEGTYRDARNAILTRQLGSIGTEGGAVSKDTLPAGHVLVGSAIAYDGTMVLFSVNSNGNDSEIGIFDGSLYTTVLSDTDLAFPVNADIQAFVVINNSQEKVVYWTDGVNPPRYYNIDTAPGYSSLTDLDVFSTVSSAPTISVDSIDNGGGSLTTGAYYFAVAYEDEDGNRTNFLTVSHPVYINDDSSGIPSDQQDGAVPETPTSKSIRLTIEDVDTSYDNIVVAVIPSSGGIYGQVKLLPERSISGSQTSFTYTGNETFIESSLDEIFANKASYLTAQTVTQQNGIMYMGNLTKKPDIGYQKFANNIKVKLLEVTAAEDIYRRPADSFMIKGYQRDEVYAFYVSFVLKNGEETRAYHIPGREFTGTEKDTVTDGTKSAIASAGKEFHFSSVGDGTYDMGYWENENENYPNSEDWDVYDVDVSGNPADPGAGALGDTTLRNTPVRHHHFPDAVNKPFYNGNGTGTGTIEIAAFRLVDVKIPSSMIDDVVAMKVYYAKRTQNNKRIIDQASTIMLKRATFDGEVLWTADVPVEGAVDAPNSGDEYGVGFIPFHLFRSGQSIGSLTHISGIGSYVGEVLENTGYANGTLVKALSPFNAMEAADRYRKVNAKAIVDHHKKIIDLKTKGFENNGRTFQSSAKVFVELNADISPSYNVTLGTGKQWDYAYNLCSYKTDLYNSFDEQELIFTGYTETNINWFDPTTPTPDQDTSSGVPSTFPTATTIVLAGTNGIDSDIVQVQYTPTGGVLSTVDFTSMHNQTADGFAQLLATRITSSGLAITATYVGNATVEFSPYTAGTTENGNEVTISIASNLEITPGNTLSDYTPAMSGGTDGIEAGPVRADFETGTIFGGDTYIGLLGLRYTEESAIPADDTQKKIILYHPVESADNVFFRHGGSGDGEKYYPKSNATEVFEMEVNDGSSNEEVFYTNYIEYDASYSAVADLKTAIPYSKSFNEVTSYPTRVIRSQQTEQSESGLDTSFRTFLANDYLDLPNNYGELVRLSVADNIIIPHMNSAILRTKGREELITGDIRAFIGAGDIFSVKPDEFISVEEGYGGLQDRKAAISTEYGYYFVDQQNKEIFELSGEGLSKLSEKGLRNFFQENITTDDMLVVYDPKYDRLLFSQADWTLSYYPTLGVWGSKHDYFPERFVKGKDNFYSIKNNTIYEHNDNSNPCTFYGNANRFDIEFIHNAEYGLAKHYTSVGFITRSINQNAVSGSPGVSSYPEFKDTFDEIRVYNDFRDTGFQDLIYFDQANGNLRNIEGMWRVNKLRDLVVESYQITGLAAWNAGESVWEDTFFNIIPNKNYQAEFTISAGTGNVNFYAFRSNFTYELIGTDTYDASGGQVSVNIPAAVGDTEVLKLEVTGSTDAATVAMSITGYDVPDPDKLWSNRGRFIGPFVRVLLRYNNTSNNLLSLSYATASYKKSIR